MAKVNFVKKSYKAYKDAGIKKGEPYYWWKFNFSRIIHRSKIRPKPSQLTQSDYLSQAYSIGEVLQDTVAAAESKEDITAALQEANSAWQDLGSECEEKLNNMPEGLQQGSSSGELLQQRIDSCQNNSSDCDSMESEIDSFETKKDEANATELNEMKEMATDSNWEIE